MSEVYLTPAQVAERLSVSEKAVKAMIKQGRLKAVRIHSNVQRIRESDLGSIQSAAAPKYPSRKGVARGKQAPAPAKASAKKGKPQEAAAQA